MLSYKNMDEILGARKIGLAFSMVFEDGDILTGCMDDNPDIEDQELIAACNKTNPKRWGKVTGIIDRKKCYYWSK